MSENNLLPKIRFPKFLQNPSWVITQLGEITNVVSNRNKNRLALPIYSISNKNGFVPQNEQFEGSENKSKDYDISLYKIINQNTFAYNPARIDVGSLGYSGSLNNIIVSSLYVCFTTTDGVDDKFLLHFFDTSLFTESVKNKVEGGIRNYLFYENFSGIDIYLPSIEEQKKIADCLSSLDDLIAAQTQKLDLLKAHKKGLMQELFPADGKRVPRLRFGEFEGEWAELDFNDLLDEIIDFRGRTPVKLGMDWGGGNILSLSANNVKNGFIDGNAECNLGSEALYDKWMGKVLLEKGDVIFTMEAPLGNALRLPDNEKYILSQRVVAFKTKPEVNNKFLIQLIWSDGFQNAIKKVASGSTAMGISQKTLKQIPVKFPPSEDEQQKIAECLSPLDDQIQLQTQKIESLKLHKKGLMQQLFPSAQ